MHRLLRMKCPHLILAALLLVRLDFKALGFKGKVYRYESPFRTDDW